MWLIETLLSHGVGLLRPRLGVRDALAGGPVTVIGDMDEPVLLKALAAGHDSCADLGRLLRQAGAEAAAIYAEGALVSLHIARGLLPPTERGGGSLTPPLPDGLFLLASDGETQVAAKPLEAGLFVRAMLCNGGFELAPDADMGPSPRKVPDLGAQLVGSSRARAIVAGPLGAALLADALSGWTWIHEGARTTWTVSRSAAEALVRAISDGRPFVRMERPVGGGIDAAVVAMLMDLGWRLHAREIAAQTREHHA